MAYGQLETAGVKHHCGLSSKNETFFERAVEKMNLSPRACQRVLKMALTIADLDSTDSIYQNHLAEAIGFRQPQRG